MAAGCDFVCKNEDCDVFDTGFTMTGPWPMGDIEDMIDVADTQEEISHLTKLKDEGRRFSCITHPNIHDIATDRFRVNFWSPKGKCIWQYDIIVEDEENIKEAIENSDVPELCPKTNSLIMNYSEVIKNGIDCPSCNELLNQHRWFSKEI